MKRKTHIPHPEYLQSNNEIYQYLLITGLNRKENSCQLNKGCRDRYVCGYHRTDRISSPVISSTARFLLLPHCVILGFGIMLTLMTNYLQCFQALHLEYQRPEEEEKNIPCSLVVIFLKTEEFFFFSGNSNLFFYVYLSSMGTMIDINWSSERNRSSGVTFPQIGR